MKNKKTASMLFSIAFIGACALVGSAAWAAPDGLKFHGSLVNAGCDARVVSATQPHDQLRTLRAGAHVSVGLTINDDACGRPALPMVVSYVERSAPQYTAHTGVVILTYQ